MSRAISSPRSTKRSRSTRRIGPRGWSFLAALIAVLVIADVSEGQSASIQLESGPYYAGVPVTLRLTMRGFSVKPACNPVAPEGAFISPGGSTQVSVGFDRKYALSQSYEFVAPKPGTYTIGPFEVEAGTVKKKTNTLTIRLEPVPEDDYLEIKVLLPEKPMTIGQRTPATVEVWCRDDRFRVVQQTSLTLSVPLYDLVDGFEFVDTPLQRGQSSLRINTARGAIRVPVVTTREQRGRETWYRISITRTLIPRRAGSYTVEPAIVNTFRAVNRRPIPIRAQDLERTLVVAELPAGKPTSWAGAIGQGFNLDVSADRTVVQIGDPIRLTLKLKGNGNLEHASLPPLWADGGLDPKQFRLPRGDASGSFADGEKTFEVTVRAMDENVTAIPPLAYSWYDPELGRYETTRSLPVALSVRGAKIVSADDVVASSGSDEDPESSATAGSDATQVPQPTRSTRSFTLTGADLSHEPNVDRLLVRGGNWSGVTIYTLYGVPLLAIAIAIVLRRRAAIDPAIARRRKALATGLADIRSCRGKPELEATSAIATALRAMISEVPNGRTPGVDAFLAECEAVVYAPSGGAEPIATAFYERAVALAESIEKTSP